MTYNLFEILLNSPIAQSPPKCINSLQTLNCHLLQRLRILWAINSKVVSLIALWFTGNKIKLHWKAKQTKLLSFSVSSLKFEITWGFFGLFFFVLWHSDYNQLLSLFGYGLQWWSSRVFITRLSRTTSVCLPPCWKSTSSDE